MDFYRKVTPEKMREIAELKTKAKEHGLSETLYVAFTGSEKTMNVCQAEAMCIAVSEKNRCELVPIDHQNVFDNVLHSLFREKQINPFVATFITQDEYNQFLANEINLFLEDILMLRMAKDSLERLECVCPTLQCDECWRAEARCPFTLEGRLLKPELLVQITETIASYIAFMEEKIAVQNEIRAFFQSCTDITPYMTTNPKILLQRISVAVPNLDLFRRKHRLLVSDVEQLALVMVILALEERSILTNPGRQH